MRANTRLNDACQLSCTYPLLLLLYPLDFLCEDDVEELTFFPAINLRGDEKLQLVGDVLDIYSEYFTIVPMFEHAHAISRQKEIAAVEPKFKSVTIHP